MTEFAPTVAFRRTDNRPVEWVTSRTLVPYPEAVGFMEQRAAAIAAGEASERVWLLEHPPLYTAGVSAKPDDLLAPARFPVFASGRGGQYTYHGPGQRVAYVMLDLTARRRDARAFVAALEAWIIAALATLGVDGRIVPGRVGVWVETPAGEAKIAAIGVRLRKWVSFHGIALNVSPDLSHFGGIVPCGIRDAGVTSLSALGRTGNMAAVDAALRDAFQTIFGRVEASTGPFEAAPRADVA